MSKKRSRDQRYDAYRNSDIDQTLDELDDLVDSFTSPDSDASDEDDEYVAGVKSVAEKQPVTKPPMVDVEADDEGDDDPTVGERLQAWFGRIRFVKLPQFAQIRHVFAVVIQKSRSLTVAVGSGVMAVGRKIRGGWQNSIGFIGSKFRRNANTADDAGSGILPSTVSVFW